MRPFCLLTALSLLLGARASFLDSRGSVPPRLDARDTPDVCATISFKFEGIGMIDGQCICFSTLSQFIINNEIATQAIVTYNQSSVTNELTNAIYVAAAASNCVYPDNSTPTCVAGMTCGFTCTDGFSPSPDSNPTTCVCSAPLVNCNGQCVAAGACASNSCQAPSKKRSWVGSGLCADMGPGWVACGVLGRGHRRSWECVNAARDLESCGGCIYPLTSHSPIGKDCSILSGVADVSCLGGECVVHRCLPGYVPAFDGTSCIRKRHHSQYSSQLAHTKDAPARMYGPGHAPLGRN